MKNYLSAAIAAACSASVCSAQQTADPVAPVRLGGPEVAKLEWDTRSLAPADFDGDGKLDVALINNDNAKIVLLYQRNAGRQTTAKRAVSRNRWEPQLEDSRFEKVSLPTDQRHFALDAADFDGDGKPDLALTGADDALTIRFQGDDASFSKKWVWKNFQPLQGVSNLASGDFDGDKKADLAVLAGSKLLVFRQKPEGGLGEPASYVTTEEKAGFLMAEDWDNDGKTDLLYVAGSGEGSLRLRRQVSPGAFSAEISLPYHVPAGGLSATRTPDGKLLLTRVNAKSKLIERHLLLLDGDPMKEDILVPVVQAPPGGLKTAIRALGDFNGDGLTDIAESDAKAAQVVLYLHQPDGTFAEPRTFPSLAGINGLAAVRPAPGKPHVVVVVSQKEGLGISRLNAEGRLEFPALQTLEGAPLSVMAVSPDGQDTQVAAVLTEKDRAYSLTLFRSEGEQWKSATAPLKTLKREPTGVRTGDLNGDGRTDVLILAGKDAAQILLAKADGSGFEEALKETPVMKSQLSELSPERVALIDLDGDKRAEILTCGVGYARALRLNPEGKDLTIADQYNARTPEDKLATPVFADMDGDNTPELVFSEAGSGHWQILRKDSAGVFRAARRLEAGGIDATEALPVKLGTAGTGGLLVMGKDRFWTLPLAGGRPRLSLVSSYETDLQNCMYYNAVPADLNGDGKEELAVFDGQSKLLEVLSPAVEPGKPWLSLMHFVLFEQNMHFRGRKGEDNVREVLVKDFTGDGRPDLLLLVHDRILLYPQE